MALELPGIEERIRLLWRAVEKQRPTLTQAAFVREHYAEGLRQQNFNSWIVPSAEEIAAGAKAKRFKQPNLDGLKLLGRVFGVPWQWILLGDEGMAALAKLHESGGVAGRMPPLPESPRVRPPVRTGPPSKHRRLG